MSSSIASGSGALLLTLLAVLLATCASGGRPGSSSERGSGASAPTPAAGTVAPGAGLAEGEANTQRLFRVRYQGPRGSGGLRLVLRLAASDRFSLAASDTLGRPVWSLGYAGGRTLVVDHRLQETCATGADVRVPEAALAPLPIEALPIVLLGRLPVAAAERDGPVDLVDGQERRWTAKLEDGRPLTWTLWSAGEPSLWWLAQPDGGVLSHRGGSQFRWRQTVVEPLAEGLELLEPPDEYPRVDCDDWDLPELRQDQPASAGDRPAE